MINTYLIDINPSLYHFSLLYNAISSTTNYIFSSVEDYDSLYWIIGRYPLWGRMLEMSFMPITAPI